MPSPSALPVVLVAGMHAEARRATVERLLLSVPGSIALHHDLSPVDDGRVHRSLRDAIGPVSHDDIARVNGCACCAVREDITPALGRLAEARAHTLAVVELWDAVEPQAMAETIAARAGDTLRLANVVTAVDPALVLPCLANGDDLLGAGLGLTASDQRTVADTWARQVEYPQVLALAPGGEADAEDRALLRQLHPLAVQLPNDSAELARAAFADFDVDAAADAQHPSCARLPQDSDEAGVATRVWRRRRPFHPERLHTALEDLTCAAVRSRGRFWLADRPDTLLSWEAAGGALRVSRVGSWLASLPDAAWETASPARRAAASLDWHPEHGDRCQHLVFTSPGLDGESLEELLDSCLLTDTEYAGGRDAWHRLRGPFDDLLDPVG